MGDLLLYQCSPGSRIRGEDSQCHLLFNSSTIERHCPGIAAPGALLTGFPFNPDSKVRVKLHTGTGTLRGSEELIGTYSGCQGHFLAIDLIAKYLFSIVFPVLR